MQDDRRGLGQGVKDNMVTHELFRLLLEERHSTNSVSNEHNKLKAQNQTHKRFTHPPIENSYSAT